MEKSNHPPFTLPLISLILGILWQQTYAFHNLILLTSIILCIFLLFIFQNLCLKKQQLLICCALFFSGAQLLEAQKNKKLLLLQQLSNKKVDIIALVEEKEEEERGKTKEIINLKIEKIKLPGQSIYQKTSFNILCFTQTHSSAQIGDQIKLKNVNFTSPLKSKSLSSKPTFFDYLVKEDILTTIFTKKLTYQRVSTPVYSLKRWLINKKYSLRKKLKHSLSSTTFCYFSSIFLGNKKINQLTELKRQFNYWGISHYLARSGLHIVLFILIWNFLLSLLPFHLYLKRTTLIMLCIIYQMLSWSSISFYRAFYVFIFYETANLLGRQTNFLHLLSFVCLVILLLNPMQLFFLDFQLSFSLTFALAWINQSNLNQVSIIEQKKSLIQAN